MKTFMKTFMMVILSISFSAIAAVDAGLPVGGKIEFKENVPRVCGIDVSDATGTIQFKGESLSAEDTVKFSVMDNGTTSNNNTLVSVNYTGHDFFGNQVDNLTDKDITFGLNGDISIVDSGEKFNLHTGYTNELHVNVDEAKDVFPAGELIITSVITVHCGS